MRPRGTGPPDWRALEIPEAVIACRERNRRGRAMTSCPPNRHPPEVRPHARTPVFTRDRPRSFVFHLAISNANATSGRTRFGDRRALNCPTKERAGPHRRTSRPASRLCDRVPCMLARSHPYAKGSEPIHGRCCQAVPPTRHSDVLSLSAMYAAERSLCEAPHSHVSAKRCD